MAIALQPDHEAVFELVREEYDRIFLKENKND
jgi:hypothetical protein